MLKAKPTTPIPYNQLTRLYMYGGLLSDADMKDLEWCKRETIEKVVAHCRDYRNRRFDALIKYTIRSDRVQAAPGAYTGRFGAKVPGKDGSAALYRAAEWKATLYPKTYLDLTQGHSVAYSSGAAFGVAMSSTTDYSNERRQPITAGNSKIPHYVYAMGPLTSQTVLYSW
jgi:hypothetical protein